MKHWMFLMKTVIVFSCLIFLVSGCGGNSTGEIIKLVSERDSLRMASEAQQKRIAEIGKMMVTINSALDSVAIEEGLLFISHSDEMPVRRDDVLKNLERYELVLRHQQQRIQQLEDSLESDSMNVDFYNMVAHMKAQLAQKDIQIASLREELSKKNVDIERLRTQVASQQTTIARQENEISRLDKRAKAYGKALEANDKMINTCYVLIGSKKDLERKGIVKKKKLLSDGALDKSKFAKVDIRKFTEITFEAKRPRILTDIPPSSYKLTTAGDNVYTLKVEDPTAFWSISNYLVIQTN